MLPPCSPLLWPVKNKPFGARSVLPPLLQAVLAIVCGSLRNWQMKIGTLRRSGCSTLLLLDGSCSSWEKDTPSSLRCDLTHGSAFLLQRFALGKLQISSQIWARLLRRWLPPILICSRSSNWLPIWYGLYPANTGWVLGSASREFHLETLGLPFWTHDCLLAAKSGYLLDVLWNKRVRNWLQRWNVACNRYSQLNLKTPSFSHSLPL